MTRSGGEGGTGGDGVDPHARWSPAGATLACPTNTMTTVSGVGAFSGCSINKPGADTLTATSGSLAAAISTSFTIATGPGSSSSN